MVLAIERKYQPPRLACIARLDGEREDLENFHTLELYQCLVCTCIGVSVITLHCLQHYPSAMWAFLLTNGQRTNNVYVANIYNCIKQHKPALGCHDVTWVASDITWLQSIKVTLQTYSSSPDSLLHARVWLHVHCTCFVRPYPLRTLRGWHHFISSM